MGKRNVYTFSSDHGTLTEQFIDREAGLCAFAGCQILPFMTPPIMKLHEQFQHGIYQMLAASRAASESS